MLPSSEEDPWEYIFAIITVEDVLPLIQTLGLSAGAPVMDFHITSIAHSVVFYDLPHFTKAFKAYYGVPPKIYRKISAAPETAGESILSES